MRYLLLLTIIFALASCQQEKSTKQIAPPADFSIDATENPELHLEKLQIYPIIAGATFLAGEEMAANFKNLQEAMENSRFRITEKKPFGRFNDAGAVNTLTIQNKSQDTVFIMSGDVVTGGNQDRIIAMDMVVPPKTITDIPVFCVEQGRWNYREEPGSSEDQTAENNKKIYAFTGYYNVASNDLRRTVQTTQNQKAVWEKVGELTSNYNATNATQAYIGLEGSDEFTHERDRYLSFFSGKFDQSEKVIGMVAISGNKVLGTDVFAHPNLFKKQYEALLHSYITEAISQGKQVSISKEKLDSYGQQLKKDYSSAAANKTMIHFTSL